MTPIIEQSQSEWPSPPVLMRKEDGKVGYCINFKKVNDHTIGDAYPLQNIEECVEKS